MAHDSPKIKEIIDSNPDNWIDANAYDRYLEQVKMQGAAIKEINLENMEQGLKFKNIKAVHPLTGDEIPLYACTYVLSDYGTGAIMGVPFHDERDCAFALVNNISMTQVIDGDEENNLNDCVLSNSREFNGLKVPEAVE